jgi:tryptophan synthase alpha chain
MKLEQQIRAKRSNKEILLMTHIVLGYPSLDINRAVIREMVDNGVDLIEMQIPFSEPMADGPIILKANQDSIANGTMIESCLEFGEEMCATHDISFLYMTYYNIVFKYGEQRFLKRAAASGIQGLILPDLPPEEGDSLCRAARENQIAPIMIYSPTSSDERMKDLDGYGEGFVYCAARKGVTGKHSNLDTGFNAYLRRCRKATSLPLAVGFGIQNRGDIEALIGHADIGVVGSQTIRLVDEQSSAAVGPFIRHLLGSD